MGKKLNKVDPRLAKLLNRVGYTRSVEKYGKSVGPSFPDLTVPGNHRERYPSGGSVSPPPACTAPSVKAPPVGQS